MNNMEHVSFEEALNLKNKGYLQLDVNGYYFKTDLKEGHENYHKACFKYEILKSAYGNDNFINSDQWLLCPTKHEAEEFLKSAE